MAVTVTKTDITSSAQWMQSPSDNYLDFMAMYNFVPPVFENYFIFIKQHVLHTLIHGIDDMELF